MPGNLNKHKAIVHEGRRFQCDQCDYSASTTGNLKIHKGIHTGVKYTCDICNYTSLRPSDIKRHSLKKNKCKRKIVKNI